jgi:hypothetical protein
MYRQRHLSDNERRLLSSNPRLVIWIREAPLPGPPLQIIDGGPTVARFRGERVFITYTLKRGISLFFRLIGIDGHVRIATISVFDLAGDLDVVSDRRYRNRQHHC